MTPSPRPRPPKKSELLEVRLSHETKQHFLAACARAGRTASDVVREAIARFIDADRAQPETQPRARSLIAMIPRPIRKKRFLAAGAGLAGLVLLTALPSAADPDLAAMFKRLDANGDGVVTAEEFWGPDVSAKVVADTRLVVRKDASEPEPVVARDSFAVLTPPVAGSQTGRFQAEGDWGVHIQIALHIFRRDRDDDPRAQEFIGMDTNQDNVISLEEYRVRLRAMLSRGFDLLDTDSDGFLTTDEFAFTGDDETLSSRLWNGGKPDCLYKDCARGWSMPEATLVAGFSELDADGDRRVSRAEYLART